jgi:histone H2B
VIKEVKPELNISKKAMMLINSIIISLFERLMDESRRLMIFSKKQTLQSREIESSIKILFPGELCKLAIQYGRESLKKVQESANN